MSHKVLNDLLEDSFAEKLSFVTQPVALHKLLAYSEEVRAIREKLQEGAITEETLRKFASSLVQQIEYGKRFPHELALAAIAVAIETRATDFSEEFIFDLARLKLPEIPLAIRVAREASSKLIQSTKSKSKTFQVDHFPENTDFKIAGPDTAIAASTFEQTFPFELV